MNRQKTKDFVTENGIVTIKADKTEDSPEIDQLLTELGNNAGAIPFYAIYPRGGGEPIVLSNIITQGQLLNALKKAKSSDAAEELAAASTSRQR